MINRMANLTRDAMRDYQRARRAQIKTDAWAAVGLPPPVKSPPVALAKDAIRERVKAEAWSAANHPAPVAPNSTSSGPPPPKSLYAVGGRPGLGLVSCGPGYPLPPDQFAASPFGRWQANVETMLATLAAKNDAQERRIVELENKVALNETVGRTAEALARVVGGLFGVRLPSANNAVRYKLTLQTGVPSGTHSFALSVPRLTYLTTKSTETQCPSGRCFGTSL